MNWLNWVVYELKFHSIEVLLVWGSFILGFVVGVGYSWANNVVYRFSRRS
jgi:hypothetical protein